MKKCKACGTEYEGSKNKCINCGCTDYLTICENCGEAFDEGFCPKCGVQKGNTGKICPVCGKKYFSAACPDCGYAPNKGNTIVITQEEPKAKKKVTVGKVLLWIFFLPIMATIAIWKKQDWKIGLKIGLTVAIWGLCLLISVGNSNNNSTNTNNTSSQSQTEQNKEETPLQSFVTKFNSTYGTPITDLQLFDVKDTENGHYRTEFRLGAYNNAQAYTGKIGDATIDIVLYGNSSKSLRIYVMSSDDELLRSVFKTAALIMDPTATEAQINEEFSNCDSVGWVGYSGTFANITFTYTQSSDFMIDAPVKY